MSMCQGKGRRALNKAPCLGVPNGLWPRLLTCTTGAHPHFGAAIGAYRDMKGPDKGQRCRETAGVRRAGSSGTPKPGTVDSGLP